MLNFLEDLSGQVPYLKILKSIDHLEHQNSIYQQ